MKKKAKRIVPRLRHVLEQAVKDVEEGKLIINEDFSIKGTAKRFDGGKARLELISPIATEGLAAVLAFGAEKYGDWNFIGGMKWTRCIGSLKRHLNAFELGIDIDEESGLPHIDHIAANVSFLQEYFRTHPELDDRPKRKKIA